MTSSDIIEKLKLLSICIDNKCKKLSDSSADDDSLRRQLLKLCNKVQKNCEVFENELSGVTSENNFNITINLLDILGAEKCKKLHKRDIHKCKHVIESLAKDYLIRKSRLNLLGYFCLLRFQFEFKRFN